jgi:predicted O-methyltransferase YrrM
MNKLIRAIRRNFLQAEQYTGNGRKYRDPVKLEARHIQNCKVLADRYEILQYMPKQGSVAEIGVLGGDFSECILNATAPATLYLIDTFVSQDWHANPVKRFEKASHLDYIKNRFKEGIENKQVQVLQGMSDKCLASLADQSLDWIYVDADHRYEAARADLNEAMRLVKPNGFIVANDYIFYSHSENSNYGVIHAVNEMCLEHNYEILYLALHPQMYCDVVLSRMVF